MHKMLGQEAKEGERSFAKASIFLKGALSRALRVSAMASAMALCAYGASPKAQSQVDTSALYTSNWSGYISSASHALGEQVTGVKGEFIVPKVSGGCILSHKSSSGEYMYEMSVWVGIGGTDEDSLVQIGIVARENVATVGSGEYGASIASFAYSSYSGFYETLPDRSVHFSNLEMRPGDRIFAGITKAQGPGADFELELEDLTIHRSFRKIVAYPISNQYALPYMSAEWVVERPSTDLKIDSYLVLPNFSPVRFDSASVQVKRFASGAVLQDPISLRNPTKVDMVDDGKTQHALAIASDLSRGGSSFDVSPGLCAQVQ